MTSHRGVTAPKDPAVPSPAAGTRTPVGAQTPSSAGVSRLSPAEASSRGRLGAHTRWAQEGDRSAATEPARAGFLAKFERQVDPDNTLDPRERAIRAEHARKAHMQRLSLAAAKARKAKRNP